jgi:hypothetical protein
MTPGVVALQAMVAFLWFVAVVSAAALVKGYFVLRRLARHGAWNEPAILLQSPLVPAISILAVARDVSPESREFVRRALALHYGSHELILVLDGLPEAAREEWIREFHLALAETPAGQEGRVRGVYRSPEALRLTVLDKEAGGEPALNAALQFTTAPLIALIDPECEFEPDVLLRLVRPLLETPGITAACTAWPSALPDGLAGRFGVLESIRLGLARGAAFAGWNRLLPVPGSALLVARDAVIEAGGFAAGPLELMLHLHGLAARQAGKSFKAVLVPDAVCRLRPPRSFAGLRARNTRDQRDIAGLVARRKSIAGGLAALGWGVPGLIAVRFIRPLVETAAWLVAAAGLFAGWISPALAGMVLLSTVGTGFAISLSAAALWELAAPGSPDPARVAALFLAAIPENLGYRQVRNLWQIAALVLPEKQNRGPAIQDRRPAASQAAE